MMLGSDDYWDWVYDYDITKAQAGWWDGNQRRNFSSAKERSVHAVTMSFLVQIEGAIGGYD